MAGNDIVRGVPLDEASLDKLKSTLDTHKWQSKSNLSEPPIADVIEQLEADHKKLGENLALLKKRVSDQGNLLLDLIRTTSK
jgi:hypothetical protein